MPVIHRTNARQSLAAPDTGSRPLFRDALGFHLQQSVVVRHLEINTAGLPLAIRIGDERSCTTLARGTIDLLATFCEPEGEAMPLRRDEFGGVVDKPNDLRSHLLTTCATFTSSARCTLPCCRCLWCLCYRFCRSLSVDRGLFCALLGGALLPLPHDSA